MIIASYSEKPISHSNFTQWRESPTSWSLELVFWHRIFSPDSDGYNSSKQQNFVRLTIEKQA